MSQPEVGADPVRRRAGLLSSLVKLYASAKTLIENDSSTEEAQQLLAKLHERYTTPNVKILFSCRTTRMKRDINRS